MPQIAFELTRATVADVQALSTFACEVFYLGGRVGADPAHISAYVNAELTPERFRSLIDHPDAEVILGRSGSAMAGYAVLLHNHGHPQIPAESPAEVKKLYVHPEYHGQGVADALMRELLISVRPGCDALWLSVYSENARAIAFYTRWSFRMAGKTVFWVGEDRQEDFLMRRHVAI